MSPHPPGAVQSGVSESVREREFYRYFLDRNYPSTRPNPPPVELDETSFAPHEEDAAAARNLRSSDDKTLTALAQLGALRLNARRCMISFFDRKFSYILAEATRTLSPQTDVPTDQDDALAWGTTAFSRKESICVNTVMLPVIPEGEDDGTRPSAFVVNDLREHPLLKERPYVTGSPHCRFYAGVPIRSPAGYNIGSYCILDDKPREGLDPVSLAFMKDMAAMTMQHLEMVKAKDDQRRGELMVRSLGYFVEGKSSLFERWRNPWESRDGGRASSGVTPKQSLSHLAHHKRRSSLEYIFPRLRNSTSTSGMNGRLNSQSSIVSVLQANEKLPPVATSNHQPWSNGWSLSSLASEIKLDAIGVTTPISPQYPISDHEHSYQGAIGSSSSSSSSADVKMTFQRAANIIREATEVDGCIFFDASIGTFSEMIERHIDRTSSPKEAQSAVFGDNFGDTSTDGVALRRVQSREHTQNTPCEIFGQSNLDGHSSSSRPNQEQMTETLLHNILHSYPGGKIFNFDEAEQCYSEDESDEDEPLMLLFNGGHTRTSSSDKQIDPQTRQAERRSRWQQHISQLHEIFPQARHLIVGPPLWDSHRGRWFAGSIIWTSAPKRVFTPEGELSYLAAFGNSIMAEVSRLDAKIADQAKERFISSISHELRSPLHGILGNLELLNDTRLDSFQGSMVQSIATCSKTLLETINHVLDFAKINTVAGRSRAASKISGGRGTEKNTPESAGSTTKGENMESECNVDLSRLTEEVLETVFTGHNFIRKSSVASGPSHPGVCDPDGTPHTNPFSPPSGLSSPIALEPPAGLLLARAGRVDVIVDIQASDNWVFQTQPGAWRRILMNLFGNALKYTDSGFIKVSLQKRPSLRHSKPNMSDIILTVTDSGRGMSKEYCRDRLFTPFAQEDPLNPGTGLGLSIIRQIIKSLGGETPAVYSEKDKGTDIIVTIPLAPAPGVENNMAIPNPGDIFALVSHKTSGLRVHLMGFDDAASEEQGNKAASLKLQRSTLKKLCTDWFGMKVLSKNDTSMPDLILTAEDVDIMPFFQMWSGGDAQPVPLRDVPVLVVCQSATVANTSQAMHEATGEVGIFEHISQPVGPQKLAKSLLACLDRRAGRRMLSKLPPPAPRSLDAIVEMPSSGSNSPTETPEPPVHRKPRKALEVELRRPSISNRLIGVTGEMPISPHTIITTTTTTTTTTPTAKTAQPTSYGRPLHILCVDDNPINLSLLAKWVYKLSHAYTTATNGLEAVSLFKAAYSSPLGSPLGGAILTPALVTTPPPETATMSAHILFSPQTPPTTPSPTFDVILMDISMPTLDGLGATRLIRAYEEEHNLPPATIIALTGLSSKEDMQDAFNSGINMFLTKPIRFTELKKVLNDLMDHDNSPGGGKITT